MKIELSRDGTSSADGLAALAIAAALLEQLAPPDQGLVLRRAAEHLAGHDGRNRKDAQRMLAAMLKQY